MSRRAASPPRSGPPRAPRAAAPGAPHGARPVRRPAARAAPPVARPRGAAVLDRLLPGRLWIGLVFVLLVGIVFFNVDLLRMNRDIAATAEKAATVKRENARLRGRPGPARLERADPDGRRPARPRASRGRGGALPQARPRAPTA